MADNHAREEHHRNWWKISFFIMTIFFLVMLISLELMREIIVIDSKHYISMPMGTSTFQSGNTTFAYGSWVRTNTGPELVPAAIRIQCVLREQRCYEISSSVFEGTLTQPNFAWYPAIFSSDVITYENDDPMCVHYSVRIDLKQKAVFAVREIKVRANSNPSCKMMNLESRIEMKLGDGFKPYNPTNGHFTPLLNFLKLATSL